MSQQSPKVIFFKCANKPLRFECPVASLPVTSSFFFSHFQSEHVGYWIIGMSIKDGLPSNWLIPHWRKMACTTWLRPATSGPFQTITIRTKKKKEKKRKWIQLFWLNHDRTNFCGRLFAPVNHASAVCCDASHRSPTIKPNDTRCWNLNDSPVRQQNYGVILSQTLSAFVSFAPPP